MKLRTRFIYIVLALVIAYLAQRLWMSELNFMVWKITYIGEQAAFLIASPNYDSAISVEIFQMSAIIINAAVYAMIVFLLHALLRTWKLRRSARKASARK